MNIIRDASATAVAADMQFRASVPPHITQLRSLLTGESVLWPRCRRKRLGTAIVRTWIRKYSKEILSVYDSYGRCANNVALSDWIVRKDFFLFIILVLLICYTIFDLIVMSVS